MYINNVLNKIQTVLFIAAVALFAMSRAQIQATDGGTARNQFSYAHVTEVVYNDQPGFALNPKTDEVAFILNKYLNQSILFDSSLIGNAKKTREYHLKKKPCQDNVGRLYKVYTDDGLTLGCTHFDRGSDTLVVVGHGFTNARENVSSFIDMFPDYDVVLFDFRGHGYVPFSLFDTDTWPSSYIKEVFGADPDVVRFGRDEDKDVCAVVKGFQCIKKYRRIFGVGICYSAFIFLKTAAQHPGIFDKLVLDGCWPSLPLFFDKICNDLRTIVNPQTGGWANHWFFGKQWVKTAAAWVGTKGLGFQIDNISLLDYAPHIANVPLLFFHCKDDYMIRRHEFEQLWNALNTEKNVILTSNQHVRNHLKQKELYKLACDLFFEVPQEQFIAYLKDPVALVTYHQQKIATLCHIKS